MVEDPAARVFLELGGIVVAFVLLVFALVNARRWRLVRDLPATRPGGATVGMLDVTATIHVQPGLVSHFAKQKCAWYRWRLQEWVSSGKNSHWKTIDSGGEEVSFYLEDDSGRLSVAPTGASVQPFKSYDVQKRSDDSLLGSLFNSGNKLWYFEETLPIGMRCSVVGYARQRPDLASLEIARDQRAAIFAISMKGASAIGRGFAHRTVGLGLLGLVALEIVLLQVSVPENATTNMIAASACYGAVAAFGWLFLAHNSMVELRQRVHQGWANVDVQLEKRYDLIHELMPLVEALGDHEATVQQLIAAMRSQLIATPPGSAGPDVLALAPHVAAVAEAYPSLVAQPQYERLSQALVACEDAIALARLYYNDIVTNWNSRITRIPDVFAASLFGCRPAALMQAFTGVDAPAPRVQLGGEARVRGS